MMREMHKRFSSEGMVVSALFPGCIAESPLFREKRGWFRAGFPAFQKLVTKQFVSTSVRGDGCLCLSFVLLRALIRPVSTPGRGVLSLSFAFTRLRSLDEHRYRSCRLRLDIQGFGGRIQISGTSLHVKWLSSSYNSSSSVET